MSVKSIIFLLFLIGGATVAAMDHEMKHNNPITDERISLNLSPMVKQHQLANMRNHVDAVRRIIAAISKDDFDGASKIASQELGLTEEMEQMCNRFENQDFREMGLAFHESGDQLAKMLKTGNVQESLQALNVTMGHCVSCHATFRQ